MARTKSRGRQKITMAKIENETTRQVTFSKRRNGLFKKANELRTLSGAEIGVIVISPGQKVYSFGHPSIEFIIERYKAQYPPPPEDGKHLRVEPLSDTNLRKLNGELNDAARELDAERKRAELLDRLAQASPNHHWWEAPIDDLNLEELEILREAMEDLHNIVTGEIQRRLRWSRELSASLLRDNSSGNTGFHLDAEPSTTNDDTPFNNDFQFAPGASSSDDDNFSQEFNNPYGHE